MKLRLVLFFALVFTSFSAFSQDSTKTKEQPKNAQNIFMEFGGNAVALSVNYDFRFTKTQKGLGMRAGLIFLGGSEGGYFALPIGLNYLIGKAPNYFESGLGYSYVSESDFVSSSGSTGVSLLVPSVGYRYQPQKNGVTFRVAFDPLIGLSEPGWITWFGVSVGYKF